MRRGKRSNTNLLIYALIALAFLALTLILWTRAKPKIAADTFISTNINENTNAISSAMAKENSEIINNNSNADNQQLITDNIKIPILMYHYIRDYSDVSDQIGINLSVSPSTLASQLDLIQNSGYETINFLDIEKGNVPLKPIILTFDDGYLDFYTSAYPELKKRGMKAVSYIITGKIGDSNYITEAQIKEVSQNSIEIGSHTISHPDLSKSSAEKARKEIFYSKTILENMLGQKIISFCYPSGKYNSEVENLIKEAGYSYAVTINGGVAIFNNPIELSRYRVNHDTNIESYLK